MNFDLIINRNLSRDFLALSTENKIKEIEKLEHIHLDQERIDKIEILDLLSTSVTHLYLQNNKIERIENIEHLVNLRCLILSNNIIQRIENIKCLKKLQILDVSFNKVTEIISSELPFSLLSLNVKNNPCEGSESLTKLRKMFPFLIIIDNSENNKSKTEETDETKLDNDGIFNDVCGMLGRSQVRVENNYHEKKTQDQDIADMREKLKNFLKL